MTTVYTLPSMLFSLNETPILYKTTLICNLRKSYLFLQVIFSAYLILFFKPKEPRRQHKPSSMVRVNVNINYIVDFLLVYSSGEIF
jgi:hypothetical protein